jgi:hypothetical protein
VLKAATVFAFEIDKPKVHPMGWQVLTTLAAVFISSFCPIFFQKFGTIGDYL